MKTPVKVFSKEIQSEVPMTWIAESVEKIAASMEQLKQSRVTTKLLVALLHDKTQLSKSAIEEVLTALSNLEDTYLKPKDKQ